MKIIKEVIAQIKAHRYSGSSRILARALYSACRVFDDEPGPPLFRVGTMLDYNNFLQYCRLARLRYERDWNIDSTDFALRKLREFGYDPESGKFLNSAAADLEN